MAKEQVSERDFYPIQEAVGLTGRKVEDLLFLAQEKRIRLYFTSNLVHAAMVYEVDTSHHINPDDVLIGSGVDSKIANTTRDVKIGDRIIYGKRGPNRMFYEPGFGGCFPIAPKSVEQYRLEPEITFVEVDVNTYFRIDDVFTERFMKPEPAILLKDLFDKNKIVIMGDDVERLLASDRSVKKKEAEPGVKKSTYQMIALGMAKQKYSYDPGASKFEHLGRLCSDLQKAGLKVSDDTVRAALEEAHAADLYKNEDKS